MLLSAPLAMAVSNQATGPNALLVPLDGPIGPATSAYIDQAFDRAKKEQARLLILEIDTPGGLAKSMRHIVKAILNASIPVVAYVAPSGARAASAGTYITYAAQIAAMAPSTNIGAATPVTLGGSHNESKKSDKSNSKENKSHPASSQEAERRKIVNDSVAYIQSLAQQRRRNAKWAEKAVRQGVSLPAEKAAQKQVVNLLAPNVQALLGKIDGKTVHVQNKTITLHTANLRIVHFSPSWRIKLLGSLSNPTLAYVLLLVGIIGVVIELLHPGATLPGTVGAISLLFAFLGFNMLPIDYTGLAFIALGVALMISEAFFPTFGAVGLGGVASFLFGSVMLMGTNAPGFQISIGAIIGIGICAILALAGAIYLFWRSRREPVHTGHRGMVGARVEAVTDFEEKGWVIARGERWQATTQTPFIKGQRGRVLAVNGLTLEVVPISEIPATGQKQETP